MFLISKSDKGARMREVVYDTVDRVTWCSCARFESDGIPCRHILFVMRSCHVNEMHSQYLLSRWANKSDGEPNGQLVGMPSAPSRFNVGKLWTIFTRRVRQQGLKMHSYSPASDEKDTKST